MQLLEDGTRIIGVYQGQTVEDEIVIGQCINFLYNGDHLCMATGAIVVDEFTVRVQQFYSPWAHQLNIDHPVYVGFIQVQHTYLCDIEIDSALEVYCPQELCLFSQHTHVGSTYYMEELVEGAYQCAYINQYVDVSLMDHSREGRYLGLAITIGEQYEKLLEDEMIVELSCELSDEISPEDLMTQGVQYYVEEEAKCMITFLEYIDVNDQIKVVEVEYMSVVDEEQGEKFVYTTTLFILDIEEGQLVSIDAGVAEGLTSNRTLECVCDHLSARNAVIDLKNISTVVYAKMLCDYPCCWDAIDETYHIIGLEMKTVYKKTYDIASGEWSDIEIEHVDSWEITQNLSELIAEQSEKGINIV